MIKIMDYLTGKPGVSLTYTSFDNLIRRHTLDHKQVFTSSNTFFPLSSSLQYGSIFKALERIFMRLFFAFM